MINILDCTLRDGGYINNWNFSKEEYAQIIKNLQKANIDYIEIGFLHHNINNDLFEDCSNLVKMVQYSKVQITDISEAENSKIKTLRIIFKKHESKDALEYCAKVKNKGYNIFTNITFCDQYSNDELIKLIRQINKIEPHAVTITDSMGVFSPDDVKRINKIVKNELRENIALCFHSHNNLNLSFLNAKTFIKENRGRKLIIDSTLYGMGRGAGNLHTEEIIKYLNRKEQHYDDKLIIETINKYIMPIYKKNPWGYSMPYYFSAKNRCHPNYAKFLIDKNINYEKINLILSSIPNEKKAVYDELFIHKFIDTLN